MQTWFGFMHSMTARVVRVAAGLWLVIYAAGLTPGYGFLLASLGTAIAVTGIADICPMELIANARRGTPTDSQRRAA